MKKNKISVIEGTASFLSNAAITDDDLFRMSYAHPTYSETLKEAYLMSSGLGALNI